MTEIRSNEEEARMNQQAQRLGWSSANAYREFQIREKQRLEGNPDISRRDYGPPLNWQAARALKRNGVWTIAGVKELLEGKIPHQGIGPKGREKLEQGVAEFEQKHPEYVSPQTNSSRQG